MDYNEKEVRQKLQSLCYFNQRTKKSFYSAREIFKEFKLHNFSLFVESIEEIKKQLNEISYPTKQLFQFITDSNGFIEDIYLNPVGVTFACASFSKNSTEISEKVKSYYIAKMLRNYQQILYPDSRILAREEYKETTKAFRSKIKQIVGDNADKSLKSYYREIYTAIVKEYYSNSSVDAVSKAKAGNPNKQYLDYISLKELYDLKQIQQNMLEILIEKPKTNIVALAQKLAKEQKQQFISLYSHTPFSHPAHTNTPVQMYKQFGELLKEYKIDNETLKTNYEDDLVFQY